MAASDTTTTTSTTSTTTTVSNDGTSGGGGDDSLDDLRQRGNHEFQEGNLDHAIVFYSMAIDKALVEETDREAPARVVNLCNRSACYYQMEDYDKAREDAHEAWKLSDQLNVKAAYRLAKTLMAVKDYEAAISTLHVALLVPHLEPQQIQSLKDLMQQATKKLKDQQEFGSPPNETTIKGINRPISIREFIKQKSLGVGNFSEIVMAQHRVTGEQFALKILERKQATDLAKRQHPNVHNEIAMEARVLLQRLPPHTNVVTMYHAFSDYYNLYYLMDLHSVTNLDLWSQLKYQGKMVGCHASQTKIWIHQLIDALEHCHSHGIVHRDLKPENILLNQRNEVVVIDFGTAKDLIETDLNGPEFVGTPDFMSPEAVTGFSGMPHQQKGKDPTKIQAGATHAADLWAMGAVLYILLTGETPFWSPSPYLSFLRIKRGLLRRNPWAIPDDDAWDLMFNLVKVNPQERLGEDCFDVQGGVVTVHKGYDVLRQHPYFTNTTTTAAVSTWREYNPSNIPSLKDLCIRACAELAKQDAGDVDICDAHPPGDGSSHDMMRLPLLERNSVLHVLDKCKLFSNGDETRVLQRFVRNEVEYLDCKIRLGSRDFAGLTQMNDEENKPISARGSQDPYAKKDEPKPIQVVHITNPLLWMENDSNDDAGGEEEQEQLNIKHLKGWKKCIATINRTRPKLVVASGKVNDKCRKFLARISDTIGVILNDGSAFYTFWMAGFQGMVLQSSTLTDRQSPQLLWIREQLEQCRMSKHQMFAFCDCDPRDLDQYVIKTLARGHVLVLVGLSKDTPFETSVKYHANETVDDDNVSIKSTDSEEDSGDEFTMKIMGTKENGLRWITVTEKEEWKADWEAVEA